MLTASRGNTARLWDAARGAELAVLRGHEGIAWRVEWTRERVPLQWAMTQNNLGTALWTLGERENGTERLLEAVEAYRDALKEWTRERVPLQWATTQNSLDTAQAFLSKRLGPLQNS